MEIHAPEGPITSLKEVFLHLGIVTIGILIALSLEGLLEWRHHRQLAAEARENIANEIRDNKTELDGLLKRAPELSKNYQIALKFFIDRLAHRKIETHALTMSWGVVTLGDSSWTTAQAVGALSYMGYAEVKKYAPVYSLQAEFLRLQQRTLDSATACISVFASGDDPRTMPEPEAAAEIARLETALASITAETQVGASLQKQYADVLSR